MTNGWIKRKSGVCQIKSDETIGLVRMRNGAECSYPVHLTACSGWNHQGGGYDIIAYRITDDHEPMTQTREQITAQIEALQNQLDAMPVVITMYYSNDTCGPYCRGDTHYFDIETINGVPHIHGIAMKECGK